MNPRIPKLLINKFQTMKSKVPTAKQIRQAKPDGTMSKDYFYPNHFIKFQNGVTFTLETSNEVNILWRKLIRMGYTPCFNSDSDEMTGLAQADPRTVFNATILSR